MAAAACGVIFSAASASAALESTQVYNYGTPDALTVGDNDSEALTIAKFDPSQGTLTGMSIMLTANDSVWAEVYNFGSATAFTDAQLKNATVTTSLNSPEATLLTSATTTTLATSPFSGSISRGTLLSPSGPVTGGAGSISTAIASGVVNVVNYSEYIGSGTVDLNLNVDSLGTASGTGSARLYFGYEATSYGQVTVDYYYNMPVSTVPEPGTLMAGLGSLSVCGLISARQFRRKNSAVLL